MKASGWKRGPGEVFHPIHMPRNTGTGLIIGGLTLVLGFAMTWQIWWMGIASAVAIVAAAMIHSYNTNRDMSVPADEVERIENRHFAQLSEQV